MKKVKRLLAKLLVVSMIMNLFSMSSFAVPQDYEGLEPICMQEEHIHDKECYEAELICENDIASDSGLESLASDSDASYTASDSNADHEHKKACYAKQLICDLEEHVHEEDCFEIDEKQETTALPNGMEIPEGYDVAYLYEDENEQFSVTVYATKDALPEGAQLVAEILDEDTDAYAVAEEALEEIPAMEGSDDEILDLIEVELTEDELEELGFEDEIEEPKKGFVALDIRFELDGEEVEPSAPVSVCINALGLIPEDADPESIAIQHHAEDSEEIEQVADSSEDTGIIEVSENEEEAALDVMSVFEVDSFSTFTITWETEAGNFYAYIHYMDTEGNELFLDGESETKVSLPVEKAYDMNLYHNGINHKGYAYRRSYLILEGEKVYFARVAPRTDGRFGYRENSYLSWNYFPYSDWGDTLHIYLEFSKLNTNISDSYFKNDINEDIKLTLYDYGSYICYGDDKAFQFGYYDREAEAIDGFPMNANTTDGLHILSAADVTSAGLITSTAPKMKRVLNENGVPEIADDDTTQGGKGLEYLFPKYVDENNKPIYLFTGAAPEESKLTDYSQMRDKANVYYAIAQHNNTTKSYKHFSYNTNFESMRFEMEGDGGLFTIDEDGYYVYDSSEMSAYYNQGNNRFELSNMLIGPSHYGADYVDTDISFGMNFMPFDRIPFEKIQEGTELGEVRNLPNSSINDSANAKKVYMTPYKSSYETFDVESDLDLQYKKEVSNMFFGMVMEIDFYVPKDGKINDDDMIFEFSGDDDVWVYLDDVMVLDLGGTHGKVDGTINFATGEVADGNRGGTYTGKNAASAKIRTLESTFAEAAEQDPSVLEDIVFADGGRFADYTKHTLKFFYLERGGNISYCKLRFNMPTLPEKSLTVTKELEVAGEDAATDMVKNALTYDFRVLQADASGAATDDLFIPEGETYTIIKDGKAIGTGTVGADGFFTLKAGEAAQFDNMWQRADDNGFEYGYIVEERLPENTKGIYRDVEYDVFGIGGQIKTEDDEVKEFTAYQTGVLKAEEAQLVTFRNRVETEALRHLSISKVDAGKENQTHQTTYQIKVYVGDSDDTVEELEPISYGTEYMVGDVKKTVERTGIIELKAGETAKLRVLPGTQFKVQEVRNTSYKYYDDYAISDVNNGMILEQNEDGQYYARAIFEETLNEGENPHKVVTVTNTYYLQVFSVTVNYLDKETGKTLKESYINDRIEEFASYDMTSKAQLPIDGYYIDSTEGDLISDSMTSDKVINVYYRKIPEYKITVNYFDKATNEKLADSYEVSGIREGSTYDVSDKDNEVVIADYYYDSTTGDAVSGTMDTNKVINVYFTKIPQYGVIVNYYDKATNEKIADSYENFGLKEGTAYDISDKDDLVIEGYTYDSTTGDALSGTMDGNKVINVYYTKNPVPGQPGDNNNDDDDDDDGDRGTTTGNNPPPSPTVVIEDPEVPLGAGPEDTEFGVLGEFEILDNMIPLAVLPATGDFSAFWMVMTALFGLSLAAVTILDRKREQKR